MDNDRVLPSRRRSVRATDLDGRDVELVFTIARKLYRCPQCRESIPVGTEHVLVRYLDAETHPGHQHWHRRCVQDVLSRELRAVRTIPAEGPRAPSARRR